MQLANGFSTLLQQSRFWIAAFAVALAIATPFAESADAQQGFLSDANAVRAGLKVAWSTQAEISSKSELVDWELIVDEDRATTYFVISYGKRMEVIAENDISPFGVPYGVDKARSAAENRKEVIEYALKNDGKDDVEVKISSYSLPRSNLFVLGAGGQVICLNADTGETRWTQQVGDPSLPSVGLGASKKHVAVANGSKVYCLDFDTGRELWNGQCKNGIDSSPTCSEEHVYVPLLNGRLQAFPIKKIGLASFMLVAQGGVRARPLTTENNVVWTTERGHMNVAPLGIRRTVSYRLKTSAPIVSQASAAMNKLFVGSLDGFVYGVNEATGQLDWDVSTGQGIMEAPVPFGEDVYVVSRAGELFKINGKEGTYPDGWQMPIRGIREIAGFGVNTIYCISDSGQLIGIDRNSRAVTKSIEGSNIQLVLPNGITDRMFFATENGFIQCVHEISSIRPRFLQSDLAIAKPADDTDKKADPSAMDEENPFGDEEGAMDDENPFGEDDDSSDDGNPFGDDDDEDGGNPFGNG